MKMISRKYTFSWIIFTLLSLLVALIFIFPMYWAIATSLKLETEVIDPDWSFFPRILTIAAYIDVVLKSQIGTWYINSIMTSFGLSIWAKTFVAVITSGFPKFLIILLL